LVGWGQSRYNRPVPEIFIDALEVRYGATRAVDGLTLRVPDGALFGLLGPNGAGKTTTLACLVGLRRPDAGGVRVGDVDVVADPRGARAQIGFVPQQLALYPDLSVLHNLRIAAGLQGLRGARLRDRAAWGLALARLEGHASQRVAALSGGMQRRLNMACALVHDPPLVVCDEPTTGVDPQSRHHLFETLRRLHREGRTILYTTHYMEEVEALCDAVAVVDHGRVVAEGTLAHLLAPASGTQVQRVTLPVGVPAAAVAAALAAAGLDVGEVAPAPRSLEDVFLELTGHSLRDGP
jgi:ABC-2 type transport system ATP-binding protein